MSRSYGNYLLLSGLLDNVPTKDSTRYKFSQYVLNPYVRVTSEDCFTKMGSREYLDDLIIGKRLLSTDEVIDSDLLRELQSSGKTRVSVRSMDTCTATGGICRKCYLGTYGEDAAEVGTMLQIPSESTSPFFRYLASTYSGSLVGIRALPAAKLPIRKSLFDSAITDAHLEIAMRKLQVLPGVPSDLLAFCKAVEDKLEKALFIIVLYSLFSSV